MLRRALSLLLVASLTYLAGCVANSDGRYADQPLTLADPLVRAMLVARHGETLDPELERSAIEQLEDVVEGAASRVAGRKIDHPTPETGDFDFIVEVDRRGTDEYEEWFYSSFHPDDIGYGAKYLFDHAGLEKGYDVIEDPDAAALVAVVDSFVLGDISRDDAETRIRSIELTIRKRLGITEDDWFANELRFDSAVDWLGAFTEPSVGCPFFRHARIEIPRSMLAGTLSELLHTYGHELLHCEIGDFESVSEDQRTIEEISCEVFGSRVVAELVRSERLPAYVLEALDLLYPTLEPGIEINGETALDVISALRDAIAGKVQDPAADDPVVVEYTDADIEAEFGRLKALYRHEDVEFGVWKKTQSRYGYDSPQPGDTDDVAEQVGIVLDHMSLAEYAQLVPQLARFDQLARLATEAAKADRLDLVRARRIVQSER